MHDPNSNDVLGKHEFKEAEVIEAISYGEHYAAKMHKCRKELTHVGKAVPHRLTCKAPMSSWMN